MNLLGHALLSFKDKDLLCGNMMGDFIKGKKILDTFPEKISRGILLHRKIDEYTDHHPAVIKAKNIFQPDYGLYAKALIDVVFDHYLANDPKYFPSETALSDFTKFVFKSLNERKKFQPEAFIRLSGYLESKEILFQYRTLQGLKRGIENLCKRMLYDKSAEPALINAMRFYYELNQHYYDFMDDIYSFVKNELNCE